MTEKETSPTDVRSQEPETPFERLRLIDLAVTAILAEVSSPTVQHNLHVISRQANNLRAVIEVDEDLETPQCSRLDEWGNFRSFVDEAMKALARLPCAEMDGELDELAFKRAMFGLSSALTALDIEVSNREAAHV